MVEQTERQRLLVLRGPALEETGVLAFLQEHFKVRIAEELDEALEAMRDTHFDAVLAETADFLPRERGIVTQQAAVVLDTIGDGVCVAGPSGELVWMNRRLREYPSELLGDLRKICRDAYEQFATAKGADPNRRRRFSMTPPDGSYYEIICSPVRDRGGLLRQVAAVVVDATSQRRQQLKLNAIDRAGRELVNLAHADLAKRDAAERLRLLEERILHSSREVLDYKHFVVLLLNHKTNRLEVLVCEGVKDDAVFSELFASPEQISIGTSPRLAPWIPMPPCSNPTPA